MHSGKLLSLLKTFTKKELRRCGEFVRSPYFNKNEKAIALFSLVEPFAPDFDDELLLKENVFKRIFPGEDFVEQKVRDVMSELTDVVENFIITKESETDEIQRKLHLSHYYERHERRKYAEQAARDAEKLLLKAVEKDPAFFKDLAELEEVKVLFDDHNRKVRDFLPAMRALDNFYLLKKLEMAALMANDANAWGDGAVKIPFLKEILQHIGENPSQYSPTIRGFYHGISVLLSHGESAVFKTHFPFLKEILLKESDEIPAAQKRNFFTLATNLAYTQAEKGEPQFYKEAFELSHKIIEINAQDENYSLPATVYEGTAALGIIAGEYDWVENFAETFKNFVPAGHIENSYPYTMARLMLRRKDFKKVLHYLLSVEFSDYDYYLSAKQMLVRAYYELGETESIFFTLEAVKKYLQRAKEIPAEVHENYKEYFRICAALTRLNDNPERTKKHIEKLRDDVLKSPAIPLKDWFLEKLDEMK
jgi:hypothetical protein